MNNLQPGDSVRFLNESLSGTIVSTAGKYVTVSIDEGFEIEVLAKELVKVNAEKKVANHAEVPKTKSMESGIYFAFENIDDTLLQLHIHQSSADIITISLFNHERNAFTFLAFHKIERNETIKLGRYNLKDFDKWPNIYFQVTLHNRNDVNEPSVYSREIKFHAKDFNTKLKHTPFINTNAYLYVFNDYSLPSNTKKLAEMGTGITKNDTIQLPAVPAAVTDLHIEKLEPNHKHLTEYQIQSIQLKTAERVLDAAYTHRLSSITFIHGVGKHVLKNKLRKFLAENSDRVQAFYDADKLVFGDGATEVILK